MTAQLYPSRGVTAADGSQAATHCTDCVAAHKVNTTQAQCQNIRELLDAKCVVTRVRSHNQPTLGFEHVWVVINIFPVVAQSSLTGCI